MTKRITKQEAADYISSHEGRLIWLALYGTKKEISEHERTFKKMHKLHQELDRKEREKPFKDEVAKFMKENPDAQSVRKEMADLLEIGLAKNLKDAYLRAMIGKALDTA